MLRLNIRAVVELTQRFVPRMLERGKGGVMKVASTAAFQPLPFLSIYGATKAFVLSFTEGLYGEYQGRGLRFFCLCPGNTKTNFHEVADIHGSRVFLAATSEEVVRKAIQKYSQTQKSTAIHGFFNNLLAFSLRLSPRWLVLKIVRLIYR